MIEEVLSEHPAIALAAAVGKPDPRVGELPVAFVCLRDGHTASESELREFSKKISERAAIPVNIYVIDKMPLTAIGKIYKPTLRLKAIEYAVNEMLASFREEDIHVSVDVVPDKRHGQLVIVDVSENASNEKMNDINNALKKLHVMSEVRRAGRCFSNNDEEKSEDNDDSKKIHSFSSDQIDLQYGYSKSVFFQNADKTKDESHPVLSAESPRHGS